MPQTMFFPQTNKAVTGKDVLITGAGGSIGSELARQVYGLSPRSMILLDINENSLYLLALSLTGEKGIPVYPEVVSIRDRKAVFSLLAQYRPQTILHAAAHKHVPLMEKNPDQAVKNNIFGTLNLVEGCEQAGAEQFVLISTDKAVRPRSVMGATKRICEQIIAYRGESSVHFTAVRFGNVLDSAGSVLPAFRQQILSGGPVRITDRRMKRFFMSIPEAAALVLQAAENKEKGFIYMLDMGEQVEIYKLAEKLISDMGYTAEQIPIIETGLRPGEKLTEELSFPQEYFQSTSNPKILSARLVPGCTRKQLDILLAQLRSAAEDGNKEKIRVLLQLDKNV